MALAYVLYANRSESLQSELRVYLLQEEILILHLHMYGKSQRTFMPTALRQRQRLWKKKKKSPIKIFEFAKKTPKEIVEDVYPPAFDDFEDSLDATMELPNGERY